MKMSDVNVDETIDFKGNQERMRKAEQQKKDTKWCILFAIVFIIGLVFIALVENVM